MKKLKIIYEDKELLVVDKESSMLTIATEKEKEKTLYNEVSTYVKKQYPKNKVFIINRLDKETSGIVLFAKNQQIKKDIQDHWQQVAKVREYLAIVEGNFKKKKGTLKNYLKYDKTLKAYCSKEGVLAITNYEVLGQTSQYSLLKINIATGKKHQIRVQLKEIGHPIVGDKKYQALKNPINRLALHCAYVALDYRKGYQFKTKIPASFAKIFPKEIIEYEGDK